ncbi:MAG: 3-deoxy-manno-octulosonate cytidylyltransferase [Flavobacteriales bacterium]
MNIIGIIPARYSSTRLPGKPLADIAGTSMIMRVYHQAKNSRLSDVIVATDDVRILDHVNSNGGKAVMTSDAHPSGTDRCLEAALQYTPAPDAIINIQGDEPFISPEVINNLADLLGREDVNLCTLVKCTADPLVIQDANRVKVVLDSTKRALYFSRSAIPFKRNTETEVSFWQHVGIYGYKLDTLKEITALPQSSLEITESLEQLRWLEHGYAIHTAETTEESLCVDTPEDLAKAVSRAERFGV